MTRSMSPHLSQQLYSIWPSIFAERALSRDDSAMAWGIACGDGWFPLIDALCRCLQRETDDGAPQVVARQVKEKLGRLRFHVGFAAGDASPRQRAMIGMAEELSSRVCDTCGGWKRSAFGAADEVPPHCTCVQDRPLGHEPTPPD